VFHVELIRKTRYVSFETLGPSEYQPATAIYFDHLKHLSDFQRTIRRVVSKLRDRRSEQEIEFALGGVANFGGALERKRRHEDTRIIAPGNLNPRVLRRPNSRRDRSSTAHRRYPRLRSKIAVDAHHFLRRLRDPRIAPSRGSESGWFAGTPPSLCRSNQAQHFRKSMQNKDLWIASQQPSAREIGTTQDQLSPLVLYS
jgi:hypothetical protein